MWSTLSLTILGNDDYGIVPGLDQDALNADLCSAIKSVDANRAHELVRAGADVNHIRESEIHHFPLLLDAVCRSKVEWVKILIEEGANLDQGDPLCASPLSQALGFLPSKSNSEIALMLIKAGAKFDFLNDKPHILTDIVRYNCHEILEALIEKSFKTDIFYEFYGDVKTRFNGALMPREILDIIKNHPEAYNPTFFSNLQKIARDIFF